MSCTPLSIAFGFRISRGGHSINNVDAKAFGAEFEQVGIPLEFEAHYDFIAFFPAGCTVPVR